MSANESKGWRDEWISKRHRLWGKNCPMQDIDTVYIEYDNHRPKLLVEYKSAGGIVERANFDCLVNLAEMASLPAIGVRYDPSSQMWWASFVVTSLNKRARKVADLNRARLSEIEYVELLYRFRGRDVPQAIREAAERSRYLERPMVEPQESMTADEFRSR